MQDDGGPGYSPLEVFRMIRANDPGIWKLLEEEDTKIKAVKNEWIVEWIASANEDHEN